MLLTPIMRPQIKIAIEYAQTGSLVNIIVLCEVDLVKFLCGRVAVLQCHSIENDKQGEIIIVFW